MEAKVPDYIFDALFAIPGSRLSLTATRVVQDFTITTDSYILLCTHLYEVLCAENSEFADKISESAFQYYAIMLLWQRLSRFLPPQSKRLSTFFRKLPYFEPHLTHMPLALEIYLKGIGNFEHSYLGEMRFRLPELLVSERFDLGTGTFGKISADTHFLYEAFPAPGIAALRILADISNTNTLFKEPIWDLPENLRPDSFIKDNLSATPKPTKNLLGWSQAVPLTVNQIELFRSCGIESTVSPTDMTKFFENSTKLLKIISEYFIGVQIFPNVVACTSAFSKAQPMEDNYSWNSPRGSSRIPATRPKLVEPTETKPQAVKSFDYPEGFTTVKPLPFTGSIIQGVGVKKVPDSFEFARSAMYCDGTVSVFSSTKDRDNLVTGAVTAGYRMPKEAISHDRHSWACYDFKEYSCVPDSWIATRNSIYKFGSVDGLNKSMWITGTTDKSLTQYSFLKKHTMRSGDNFNIYML